MLRAIKVFGIAIVLLASLASILGLYFTVFPTDKARPGWHWIALIVLVIVVLGAAAAEILDYIRSGPKSFTDATKINAYMRRWLSGGGRAVICSRDMSWTNDETTRELLREKSKRNELTVCLEKDVALTDELRGLGAAVITYGELGHVPSARFTIIDYERDGARVAVGYRNGSVHEIQEFRRGHHPFFALADDFAKFMIAYQRQKKNVTQY